MARTLSTKKRVRQTKVKTAHHRGYKTQVKSSSKRLLAAIAAKKPETAQQLRETVALIQRVAGKGVIHKNKAANMIARLAKAIAK